MTLNRQMHPRPQFIRKDWQLLDGEWDFAFDDNQIGLKEKWFNGLPESIKINVPFTYETKLSGIERYEQHKVVWYQRELILDDSDYVLNFEGVDYHAEVWLNGVQIGTHTGGYTRFSLDLENFAVSGSNQLVVRVQDSLANEQPRGKQTWKEGRFGCWYIGNTGIWKSVWLEKAQSQRLAAVKMTPDLDDNCIILEPILQNQLVGTTQPAYFLEATVEFDGEFVSYYKGSFVHEMTPIKMDTRVRSDSNWGTKKWLPQLPDLYDIRFVLYDEKGNQLDEVFSYFGMRKISIENGHVLLNNEKLYQRLILDQGYWAESGLTPPSVEALKVDVQRIKDLGYNGVRKHQKIEDERYMYLCDKLGLLVWAEMPSTYVFNDLAIENLTQEWMQVVKQHYNHPCVITWVPFNESWGINGIVNLVKPQQLTEGIYHLTKAFDSNRPVVTNDGWEHTISDILTLHDYEEFGKLFTERYADRDKVTSGEIMFNNDWFAFAEGYEYQGQPIIISEFGGIAFSTDEKENWGYGNQVKNNEEFMKRFDLIHEAIQKTSYISGYCYTQLTDVEQEVNGLLNPDREFKVPAEEVRKINERRMK
ncbi:glycoside hydrolase family 2 [Enterococcus sp. JM4C]|uniref:glycoside hydrolase family 2 protein n=1 Tax=Candidatus Enterococcus huntleyi TaxID=1857217 RepID=UPI001379C09E|nr:sugar-binding domain-containing protein [Enterococcus sp. JM4C]KAF1295127.1 glycoside hydrolase family 2 [Enterococcus sp. JM4C]